MPGRAGRRAADKLVAGVTMGTVLALAVAPSPSAAEVVPAGTIILIEDAAWSWFEDERLTFTDEGTTLATSAVAGLPSVAVGPGTVVLAEVDLATGARRLVDLGRGEADDHNSASIYEAPNGELTTAWARHSRDGLIRTQRQRTDGSWLRLPPLDLGVTTTYSNLRAAADAEGQAMLYDFVRGERYDPEVLASPDVGRTWTRLGRVLRDPLDSTNQRPYVQYSPVHDGRIDLLATETHPRESQTSVYHGYIEGGVLHDSTGAVLGALGTAVPVTALTRVWAPSGAERAWTSDVLLDPVSGRPTVVFSVRLSPDDHRYWFGRWDGAAWRIEEIAFAGRALYEREQDYTGLVTLDPTDGNHVVVSTDADPSTGEPLVSTDDGVRHWELWDGRRSPNGGWTWTAVTRDSTTDNLRPVLAADRSRASALAWMRGRYSAYTDYDVVDVDVVRRPGGAPVGAGTTTWSPATDVLPAPAPRPQAARPVVGHFDGHQADDVLLVRPGSAPEDLFLGDEQRHSTPVAARSVIGTSTPIPGDYDADGDTDIYWYAPGPTTDHLWNATPTGFTTTTPRQVTGTYTPIPGDLDGDGADDVRWYAPGPAADYVWWSEPGPLASTEAAAVNL